MKKKWKHSNSVVRGVLTAACALIFFVSCKSVCFAEATAKVKVPSARVRQTANDNSEVIGSSSRGTTVTIISQTSDASGYTWYEVYVDANTTGYIRADLLDVDSSSGTIPTSASNTSTQSSEPAVPTASGAEIMPETGMDAQYATIKARSAIIRSAASKNKGKVDSLSEGTQVIVSGQTEGSDMTWYYITFTGTNGVEKTGYVRSDLITLGEMVPVAAPEEQPQEQPEPETPEEAPTVRQDYELIYELDEKAGENAWYVYDRTDPGHVTKQRIDQVLAAAHAQTLNNDMDAKTVSKQRIVIIVLIAVIIILAVVMTIMIFKLRDAYYEAYEEDEDEEEEDDRRKRDRDRGDRERDKDRARRDVGDAKRSDGRRNESRGDDRRSEDRKNEGRNEERRERADREEPVRRKSAAREEKQPAPRKRTAESDRRMPAREVSYEDEMTPTVKAAPKKKAKNFLIDDDDFEFEFLNTKNKDKDI